jgi:hypothetical protein
MESFTGPPEMSTKRSTGADERRAVRAYTELPPTGTKSQLNRFRVASAHNTEAKDVETWRAF